MAISFKAQTDNEVREGSSGDVVGRFRSGFQTKSGRPVGLSDFRITSGDEDVLVALGGVLGQDDTGVSTWETVTDESSQIFTTTSELDIIVEKGAIKSSLVLWSQAGKRIIETDGEFLYDMETGKLTDQPWPGASQTIQEIKTAAKQGVGPSMSLQLYFRIADPALAGLGMFKFYSGSWTAVDSFNAAEAKLDDATVPMLASFGLERVEFTAADGTEVQYSKPFIKIKGAA
jgi:hypothetical protein